MDSWLQVELTVSERSAASVEQALRELGALSVTLADPGSGRDVSMWVDERHAYLMLFTGDPLAEVRRRSLAVEPMTCPPNAFRSGEAVIELAPGESTTGAWGISTGAR